MASEASLSDVDQALRIETRLRQLEVERSNLLRQLNDFRATTRAIPPEILSEIFVLTAAPLRIGAVCSLWREISWSTPELWTTIRCGPTGHDRKIITNNCLYLLRLFFKNSGQLKVAVELNMDQWDMPQTSETIRELLTIVTKKERHRIKTLTLKSSDTWDARLWKAVYPFFYTTCFPNLENLHLLGGGVCPLHEQVFKNAPRLRELSLSGAHDLRLPRDQPFWNQITVLRLQKTMAMYCFGLLQFHPLGLEVFECVDPTPEPRSWFMNPESMDIIAPLHLTSFEWTGELGSLEAFMWRCVRLPAVRRLTWNCPHPLKKAFTHMRHDFFRSLSKLEYLKIQQYHSIHELHDVWQCLDLLRELELDARKLEKEGVDIMDVLTLVDDLNRQNLLPNLKVLRIDVLVGHGISRMLRSRRDGPLVIDETRCASGKKAYLRLEKAVIRMEDLMYEPGEREVLGELIYGGLQLDMVIGDERAKWF